MEHRWGSRVRADVEVELFAFPASAGWGRIRDISLSGGHVETPIVIAPLTRVRMRLFASGRTKDEDEEVVINATVVRQTAHGLGVEWTDWNIEAIARLVREAQEANAEERGMPSWQPTPGEQETHLTGPHSRRTEVPPLISR
jgi:hypothetical protein